MQRTRNSKACLGFDEKFKKTSFVFLLLAVVFLFCLPSSGFASQALKDVFPSEINKFPKTPVDSLDHTPKTDSVCPPDTIKKNANVLVDVHSDDYIEGLDDGKRYHNCVPAFTVNFITTSLIPPVGLLTTLLISNHPVKVKSFELPYPQLQQNFNYYSGYKKGAKIMKKNKSWLGFGSGLLFFGGILFTINFIYLQ